MYDFSAAVLDRYRQEHGATLAGWLVAYRIEDGGAHLFQRIAGNCFSILGLRILELLGFLRRRGQDAG